MGDKKSLNTYAKENSTFVSIDDGGSYTAIYKGYKFIEKDFAGETNEYVRYLFEDLEDKIVRNFDSRSGVLAKIFEEIKEGTKVTISRKGEGLDTKYTVKIEEK